MHDAPALADELPKEQLKQFLRPVVGFHLATRALTLAALWIGGIVADDPFSKVVTKWDGRWYGLIVENGYPDVLPVVNDHVVTNPAGFFPLFPYSVKPLVWLGLPYWLAAILIVPIFSTLAVIGISMVVRTYTNDRVAQLTTYCWSVFPSAAVLSVAYAEGIFTMLAAPCLYFLLRRRWLLAGIFGTLASFSRPTGVVIVAAVGLTVLDALIRRHEWRALVAAVLAPLGTIGAIGFIGSQTDRWDAYIVSNREGWGVTFDAGLSFWRWAVDSVTAGDEPLRTVFVAGVVGVLILTVIAVRWRPPLPVLAYLVLGMILAVGQGGEMFLSPMRFTLPIFPMLIPVATWLNDRNPRQVQALLAMASLGSAAVGVYYFTAAPGAP